MRLRQTIASLPPHFAGSNLAAEILISADGRFLYVSNRLHNAFTVFAVAADGELHLASEAWAHADYPRSAAIDPGGHWLFSCNQRGDSITSFRINAASGALQWSGWFEPVGSPARILVLRPR
jgi:6-phosphogluconolactonase (cycloisomerase 2 family)